MTFCRTAISKGRNIYGVTLWLKTNNDLLTGLLSPYWEIRSPYFFVRSELARAVRKSEGFVFLVQTE